MCSRDFMELRTCAHPVIPASMSGMEPGGADRRRPFCRGNLIADKFLFLSARCDPGSGQSPGEGSQDIVGQIVGVQLEVPREVIAVGA